MSPPLPLSLFDRAMYFTQGSEVIWLISTKRLTTKNVLGKSFEALLSGVSTGICTVMAASTVILPWSIG